MIAAAMTKQLLLSLVVVPLIPQNNHLVVNAQWGVCCLEPTCDLANCQEVVHDAGLCGEQWGPGPAGDPRPYELFDTCYPTGAPHWVECCSDPQCNSCTGFAPPGDWCDQPFIKDPYAEGGPLCTHLCDPSITGCVANADCEIMAGTGMAVCSCPNGYEGDPFTGCTDIDECADPALNTCDESAVCVNMPSYFECNCNEGYEGDGFTCTDIDECSNPALNPCDENAACTNTMGGYVCECNEGYDADRGNCLDIDECADPSLNTCDENAICSNMPGYFECHCNQGYEGDGYTCTDFNECTDQGFQYCDSNAACTNTIGSYYCECNEGYSGDGVNCQDVDECADPSLNNCYVGISGVALCTNTEGSFNCECPGGSEGDGVTCTDIDECADPTLNDCDENADCINTLPSPEGGFTCDCRINFVGDGTECTFDDPCGPTNPCGANSACSPISHPDRYTCACLPGYVPVASPGIGCEIDGQPTDLCSGLTCGENALCQDIPPGGAMCRCRDGYEEDPLTGCTDINECSNPSLNNCDENAFCINQQNGFRCECKGGYQGDGVTCLAVDECSDPSLNDCATNAICSTNTDNTFYTCDCPEGVTCTCPEGYHLAFGSRCRPGPGPCESLDCGPNSMCSDMYGGMCSCLPGHTGEPPNCGGMTGGIVDDPHILLWGNRSTWYDFQGECDLVLVEAPEFEPGLGLKIHVRTTIRYDYSFITNAVLQIGDEDSLEVASWGDYYVNRVGGMDIRGVTLAGKFPVYHEEPKSDDDKVSTFHVVIGPNENITMSSFKDLVSVKIHGGTESHFGKSVGLMGSYEHSGYLLKRDGTEVVAADNNNNNNTDLDFFGQEWQVNSDMDGPMLFQTSRAPQYPEKCRMPVTTSHHLRKRGGGVDESTARKACAHLAEPIQKACVSDILAVGDLDIAKAGTY